MSVHVRCEELLREAEKVLHDAGEQVAGHARGKGKATAKRRRNALNAACNALHRAVHA